MTPPPRIDAPRSALSGCREQYRLVDLEKPGPQGQVQSNVFAGKLVKINSKFEARSSKQSLMTKIDILF